MVSFNITFSVFSTDFSVAVPKQWNGGHVSTMLVVQANLAGVKLFSYVNAFFSLKMFVMQIYRNEGKYLHEKNNVFWQNNTLPPFLCFGTKFFVAAVTSCAWKRSIACLSREVIAQLGVREAQSTRVRLSVWKSFSLWQSRLEQLNSDLA